MSTTILEPGSSSSLATSSTPNGIITNEVDRQYKSALISQIDSPTNQSGIAPDNQLTASAVSSNSPMEYDKRFVFI
jgi:hypothetical protein